MSGFGWKRNAHEILERRRRFLRRDLQNSILAILPVELNLEAEWRAFEQKWGMHNEGETREFPSPEEILERAMIGLRERAEVEDDWLPIVYSIRDAGESMVGAVFGAPTRFLHRWRDSVYSKAEPVVTDYSRLQDVSLSLDSPWIQRFLAVQEHFKERSGTHFSQHPSLTMDALNFVVEMRGATMAYLDLYEYPEEVKALMEIGLDFNIRFQEAQMERTGGFADGSFVYLAGWVPFPRAIGLSVDAYVSCSIKHYAEFGFDLQRRLIKHFGHGMMHFHSHRADLAAEVAKLPKLELFQFGGDTKDGGSDIDKLPQIRKAVGDIPIQVSCTLEEFKYGLRSHELSPNVWYVVAGGPESFQRPTGATHPQILYDTFLPKQPRLSKDEANRLMEEVRAYRA